MKHLDELLNETLSDQELEKVKPEKIDEKAVLNKTLSKLGMAPEYDGWYVPNPDFEPIDPDKLVYLEPEKPRRRGWRVAAGAAAACLVCAFTLFTLVPSAAEAIPGLGRLFHAATQGTGTVYNRENLEWIQAHMQNVTDCVSTTQWGDLSFAVKEAYYDGKYLYCVAQIETALDPNDPDTDWSYRMKINGRDVDFDYTNSSKPWAETGENTYVNDGVSFAVPMEYRPEEPGDIRVEYQAEFYRLGEEKTVFDTHGQPVGEIETSTLGRATAAFTAPYDPDSVIEVKTEAEENDVRLLSFTASPAGTELILDVPYDDRPWFAGVELKSGGQVTMNSASEYASAFSEERHTKIVSGESVPYDEKAVVVTVSCGNQKAAAFEVDLENKTVTVGDETFTETEKARQDAAKAEDIPRQWREDFEKGLAEREKEAEEQALREMKERIKEQEEKLKEAQAQAAQGAGLEFNVTGASQDGVEVIGFSLRDDLERVGTVVRIMPDPCDDDEELKKYSLRLFDPDGMEADGTGTQRYRSGGESSVLGCEFATGLSAGDDLEGKTLTLQILYGDLGKETILVQFDIDLAHQTVEASNGAVVSYPME